MTVRLSVVIVSFNTSNLLGECLRSIYGNTVKTAFETIVVDNGSTDGTRPMLREVFPHVRTILNDENRRWAGANNQGAAVAEGEYLLFLNSDTVVLGGALDAFVGFFDGHPRSALAGCRLVNPDRSLQLSCRGFPTPLNLFSEAFFLYLLFPRSKLFGKYYLTNVPHDSAMKVDMVSGAALGVRKSAFERIGPFDEGFYFYGEEMDYCFRAGKLGYDTWYFPDGTIIHYGGGSPQVRRSYHENLYSGVRRFLAKHHRGYSLATMVALYWLGVALRVPVYFLAGVFRADRELMRKSGFYSGLLFRRGPVPPAG